jgi:hypothetical protein
MRSVVIAMPEGIGPDLALRIYSTLLGSEPRLLHGGGKPWIRR